MGNQELQEAGKMLGIGSEDRALAPLPPITTTSPEMVRASHSNYLDQPSQHPRETENGSTCLGVTQGLVPLLPEVLQVSQDRTMNCTLEHTCEHLSSQGPDCWVRKSQCVTAGTWSGSPRAEGPCAQSLSG